MNFKTILLTTDLSEASLKAFEIAAHEAKMSGAKIYLLHIYQGIGAVPIGGLAAYPEVFEELKTEQYKSVTTKLEKMVEENLHGQEVEVVCLEPKASAGEDIVKFAEEHGCEAILIASTGRSSLSNFVIGSTVQRVLQNATCPVIVVPTAKKQ